MKTLYGSISKKMPTRAQAIRPQQKAQYLSTYREVLTRPLVRPYRKPPKKDLVSAKKIPKGLRALSKKVPDAFDWSKEKFILQPLDQQTCGNCWAFSLATVISDRYAIALKKAGKHPVNPNISPSGVMSCISQRNKANAQYCQGAFDLNQCFQDWEESPGIETMQCSAKKQCGGQYTPGNAESCDYKWCEDIQNTGQACDAMPLDSFFEPYNCKYFLGGCNPLYRVTRPIAYEAYTDDYNTTIQNYNLIKEEIYENGPVVTNMICPTDFKPWFSQLNLTDTDIYVVNTSPDGVLQTQAGGHAIVIVGWGEGYLYDDDTTIKVEMPDNTTKTYPYKRYSIGTKPTGKKVGYWIIRNSWGQYYPQKGFFKALMASNLSTETKNMMTLAELVPAVYSAMPVLQKEEIFYTCENNKCVPTSICNDKHCFAKKEECEQVCVKGLPKKIYYECSPSLNCLSTLNCQDKKNCFDTKQECSRNCQSMYGFRCPACQIGQKCAESEGNCYSNNEQCINECGTSASYRCSEQCTENNIPCLSNEKGCFSSRNECIKDCDSAHILKTMLVIGIPILIVLIIIAIIV
jgi:hypothetical protein